jgi:hypothetical protein
VDTTVSNGRKCMVPGELEQIFTVIIFEDLIGDKVWWDSGLAGGAESEQWLGSQGRYKGHCLAIGYFVCSAVLSLHP